MDHFWCVFLRVLSQQQNAVIESISSEYITSTYTSVLATNLYCLYVFKGFIFKQFVCVYVFSFLKNNIIYNWNYILVFYFNLSFINARAWYIKIILS